MSKTTPFWPEAPELRRADIGFSFRGHNYLGHLVAPPAIHGPKPMVMVIHNYQGLKYFDVDVAEYIARLGYTGFAIDLYGDTVPADERLWPMEEQQIAGFQKKCFAGMVALDHDHELFRDLLKTWLDHGLAHEFVDGAIAPAAMGYCFGGVAVLEAVRGGLNFGGVVSLHGLLQTGEDPNPSKFDAERPPVKTCSNHYNTQTVVIVENGADDELVPDDSKQRFFAEMDGAGVDWVFHHYAGTPHGFALPPTLGPPGKLHESTDRRSTMNLLNLLREIFPGVPQNTVLHNASGTSIPS